MIFDREAFLNSYNRSYDKRAKKTTMEQELAQKRMLMQEQAGLENQSLSAEEKLFRLYAQNPEAYGKFKEASNSFLTPYQQGMLGIQGGQLKLQGAKLGQESVTSQQKNYEFLRKQGVPHEEALDRSGLRPEKKKPNFSFTD